MGGRRTLCGGKAGGENSVNYNGLAAVESILEELEKRCRLAAMNCLHCALRYAVKCGQTHETASPDFSTSLSTFSAPFTHYTSGIADLKLGG